MAEMKNLPNEVRHTCNSIKIVMECLDIKAYPQWTILSEETIQSAMIVKLEA